MYLSLSLKMGLPTEMLITHGVQGPVPGCLYLVYGRRENQVRGRKRAGERERQRENPGANIRQFSYEASNIVLSTRSKPSNQNRAADVMRQVSAGRWGRKRRSKAGLHIWLLRLRRGTQKCSQGKRLLARSHE